VRVSSLLPRLWTNWITVLGSIITTVAGFAIIFMVVVGFSTSKANPYLGLFVVLVLPVAFALGLLLIPIGLFVERKRGAPPHDSLQAAFEAAFKDPAGRRRIFFAAAATLANIGLFALAGQKIIEHMDSPKFCGTQCHTPMQPQWEAYNRSPHSNVACVDCHIGPGAAAEVKAKWNGVHQLVGVLTSRYERPITAPPDKIPSAKGTCEQCHAPQRFRPDLIKLFPHYAADKDNTPKFNAMLLRVGGFNQRTQKWEGVHWHANPDNRIQFELLDEARTKIGKVTRYENGRLVAEYVPPGASQKPIAVRTMDCIDCHNRPTHVFDYTPKDAVDRALFAGALDPKVPYLAATSAAVLADTSAPRDGAEARLRAALDAAYHKDHPDVTPDPAALDKAAKTLAQIYLHNIYPSMKMSWRLHPPSLGHMAEGQTNPGCFRCHDKQHETTLADGRKKKIGQDCDTCHTGLAFDQDPAKFDDTLAAMMPAAN
jgi:nitrate/TMAO reductase-like tetraheme cytochrome c subunit